MRWFGFFLAFTSMWVLAQAKVETQAFGWFLGCSSALCWMFIANTDKDLPRFLMETMYFILAALAVYNWL
tara:strand:- start:1599 stop:1808 length:210 start_codon:yes stop_codon:yes gene_type:complete